MNDLKDVLKGIEPSVKQEFLEQLIIALFEDHCNVVAQLEKRSADAVRSRILSDLKTRYKL